MSLLKELMNRGYLIYDNKNGYTVSKTATPNDRTTSLDSTQTHVKQFPAYDEALVFCKERIGWVETETPSAAPNSGTETFWQMELMYRHSGLGLQSAILGQLKHVPYELAKKTAKDRAEEYIQTFQKDEIEGWEVRVRPCVDR